MFSLWHPITTSSTNPYRIIEYIPADITPEVTEPIIHRDYCPHCRKIVDAVVPDAIHGACIGHRTVVFSAFGHYAIGVTLSQIECLFNSIFFFVFSIGGLIAMWRKLALTFLPWYTEIGEAVKQSPVVHADETSWRVQGTTYWLWCFTTSEATYYLIDKSRGHPAIKWFCNMSLKGILVSDFWSAYWAIVCAGKQMCLVHLFRELRNVGRKKGTVIDTDWLLFRKQLKRLLRDTLRLRGRLLLLPTPKYEALRQRMTQLLPTGVGKQGGETVSKTFRKISEEFIFVFVSR